MHLVEVMDHRTLFYVLKLSIKVTGHNQIFSWCLCNWSILVFTSDSKGCQNFDHCPSSMSQNSKWNLTGKAESAKWSSKEGFHLSESFWFQWSSCKIGHKAWWLHDYADLKDWFMVIDSPSWMIQIVSLMSSEGYATMGIILHLSIGI